MIKTLMNSNAVGLKLAKHSPEILIVVGVLGVIGSTVLACKATLKCQDLLDETQEKLTAVKTAKETFDPETYTTRNYQKDLTVVYVQSGVGFIKLYGPAVALCAASLGCLIGSHRIMKTRNVALMAAYKTIEEGFTAYRNRVKEEYGEEKDYMYKHGLRQETVVETEVGEDGKSKKVKKTKLSSDNDTNGLSAYARFFDESCSQWTKTPEYNFMFLKAQQNYFNDMLRARGHVFLNEVYDAIGLPRSQAGAVVGWVIGEGDSFIDFGIFEGERRRVRDFVNGYERSILLDFNVDGVIYDMI